MSELCDWLTLRWDEMWGKSVLSPDWSRWRGNDSCAASRLSSHWCRLRARTERLFLHLSSSALEEEEPEILRQNESFSFLNSFTNRGRQISGLMFERLSSGPALLFSWLGRLWPLQCSRLPDPRGDSASKYLTRNQKIESGGDFTAQIKQSAGNIPSRDAFFSDIFVSGSIKTINCLVTVIITAGEMVASGWCG